MSDTMGQDAAARALTAAAEVAGPVDGPGDGKPKRASFREVFKEMPLVVKLASIWLIFIFGGAIYAKVDTGVFGGALPLQDPNFQTNNFDPDTGTFGDGEPIEGPSAQHWLGTDAIARDTFARIVHGGWVSLIVAMVAAGFGIVVGGFLGSLVGFVRGKTEIVIMSVIDVILAFPALILLLALVSIFKVRDLLVISLVIGFLSIPAYTRVARAISLAISNREFVLAARAIGTQPATILRREIIPNVAPTVISYAMVAAAFVIVVEGSLSFLGLSVQLPTSSWGNMINQARRDIDLNLLQVVAPSLALVFTVLSLNQVGDWFQKRASFRGSAL
jgi:peptide/nickel transport system permease protein